MTNWPNTDKLAQSSPCPQMTNPGRMQTAQRTSALGVSGHASVAGKDYGGPTDDAASRVCKCPWQGRPGPRHRIGDGAVLRLRFLHGFGRYHHPKTQSNI